MYFSKFKLEDGTSAVAYDTLVATNEEEKQTPAEPEAQKVVEQQQNNSVVPEANGNVEEEPSKNLNSGQVSLDS